MLSLFSLPLLLASTASASTVHARNPWAHAHASVELTSPAPTTAHQSNHTLVAATWFTGWHAQDFPVSNVSWDKYTHVTFAFAVTTPDITQLDLAGEDDILTDLVKTAHSHDVKALISVGGWTGSRWFSSNVATHENRTEFVKTIVNLKTKYNVDGVDFDWEYPSNTGIGCNVQNTTDAANFLTFLQQLRADPVGKNLILTAAASPLPWIGADGESLTDVSGFAQVLDWIAIMNYDIWGPWNTKVGPNAPLNDTCVSDPTDRQGSAVSSVNAWHGAGMPLSQIVLGVAAYGHSYVVDIDQAITCDDDTDLITSFPTFDNTTHPVGDAWDDPAGIDECGNYSDQGGEIDFWGLIDAGYLNANGTVAPGIDYRFDECSQTAYVYNETSQIMVSFDDAPSFTAKGKYISSAGLRGFALWETGGDKDDILLDAILTATGHTIDDDDDC